MIQLTQNKDEIFLLHKHYLYYILFDLLYYLPVNHYPFARYKADSFVRLSYANYNTKYYVNVYGSVKRLLSWLQTFKCTCLKMATQNSENSVAKALNSSRSERQ